MQKIWLCYCVYVCACVGIGGVDVGGRVGSEGGNTIRVH